MREPIKPNVAEQAAIAFETAARERDPLLHIVCGLRAIAEAALVGTLAFSPVFELRRLEAAIVSASDGTMGAARYVPAHAVALGFTAALCIIDDSVRRPEFRAPAELAAARIDHVLLLADELDAQFRRQCIERGGDLLRRHVTIQRAMAADVASLTRQ
ncbi:hypothetical protein [Aureimonas endophytica]|uniref:hypothetical protein n=1 Tax=Aureimonas endophytica TaxID=2027858 RepID=UPI00166D8875|nr:hypothetical protein [Aureimonas endophytica]